MNSKITQIDITSDTVGDIKPKKEDKKLSKTIAKANHQNSLRRARPLKMKYFLMHVTTDSTGFIIGLAVTRG